MTGTAPASGNGPATPRTLQPSGLLRWIGLPISVLAILVLANSVDIPAALGVLTSAYANSARNGRRPVEPRTGSAITTSATATERPS